MIDLNTQEKPRFLGVHWPKITVEHVRIEGLQTTVCGLTIPVESESKAYKMAPGVHAFPCCRECSREMRSLVTVNR